MSSDIKPYVYNDALRLFAEAAEKAMNAFAEAHSEINRNFSRSEALTRLGVGYAELAQAAARAMKPEH